MCDDMMVTCNQDRRPSREGTRKPTQQMTQREVLFLLITTRKHFLTKRPNTLNLVLPAEWEGLLDRVKYVEISVRVLLELHASGALIC